MGIGSDIGGSVRHPCSSNGVTGLKPTAERVTTKGLTHYSPGFDGQKSVKMCIGTFSKYVEDSALMI